MPAEGAVKPNPLSFFFFIFVCAFAVPCVAAGKGPGKGGQASGAAKELVVYAYDSFVADWGPGPELARRFEAKTGYRVTFISCGDAAQVLSRAALEKANPSADVLVGIDNNLIDMARASGVLEPYKSPLADSVVSGDLRIADDWLLTPYDYGYFAIIFDTASHIRPPVSLEDLAKPEYAKKIILMDPRTSTPGTGFLAWTIAVYGNKYLDYWARIKGNILTLAPSWDSGYGLFTSGEAPLVISYTTSPAYHLEIEKSTRYRALVFAEGHPAQIEGLGLVKGARNPAAAKAFIDFMLTDEAQSVLPLTQWMYPVAKTVKLPESFRAAPSVTKTLTAKPSAVAAAIDPAIAVISR
jgi:thiamine transport system substrate-binding protein